MERLTSKHPSGLIAVPQGMMPEALNRLAAYEDTGLEPEEIKKAFNGDALLKMTAQYLGTTPDRLHEWAKADKEDRLVALPCKVGDAVFAVGERLIKKCDIDEVHVDKFGVEYLVSFICADDCDGCPFNSWHQDYSGEYSCHGEWGQAVIRAEDFGKTVFLSRKEAEAALAGERKDGEG